jgi:hypothetical protein
MVATRPAVMDFVFINTVCCIVMVEDKFVTVHAVEEYRYSSTYSQPRRLAKVSGQRHALAALPAGNKPIMPTH